MMDLHHLSMLSSLKGDLKSEDYVQPHYRESYRLAIDRLVTDGRESYHKFLKAERVGGFLSEDELLFITANVQHPAPGNHTEESNGPPPDTTNTKSSTGTYWPMHSDVPTPELVLGWPDISPHARPQTHVELLFHPPRQNHPTIKEVIRKNIQDARQVVAIVMDMFTDIDIFKETVNASLRGVPVYVLLDESHLKSFLTMAENQDVKVQQLRNMRVRTVKGHDYLCRSGAKFHGAMQQRFLLVDCQTVIYGTYSFMWSYEKIHLSMVQVIRGHLVASYDEEFRTLYARSTVPAELCPPEGLAHDIRPNGRQIMSKYVPNSGQGFERKDQLRHTLDQVYRKTCERQMGMRDIEERLYEDKPIEPMPAIHPAVVAHNRMNQLQPPSETVEYLKRHSYAGERQDASCLPQNARHRSSNWNIAADVGVPNSRTSSNTNLDNFSQGPQQMFRGANLRQSLHGIDQQGLSVQQNTPSPDGTSRSFMRTWRIESYLKNTDSPLGGSTDYLDQYEIPDNKATSFKSSRMRSSLALQSTIPEQLEISSYTKTSAAYQADPSVTPNSTLHYSSMQWNPTVENRMKHEEFLLKRQSLQILDDDRNNMNYGPGKNFHHPHYASLGRIKGGAMPRNPNNPTENWLKRHSLADPRTNTDDCESPGTMYGGAFARRPTDRGAAARANAQNGGHGLDLNEDQRSVSHYDVKSITRTKTPPEPNWQDPPSRTMSAAILDVNGDKEPTSKSSSDMSSPPFLKKSSKKIRSLLHIPEKKESSSQPLGSIGGSTDTITGEDEEQNAQSSPNRYSSDHQRRTHLVDDSRKASCPRFRIEDPRPISPTNMRSQQMRRQSDKTARPSHEVGDWRKGAADSRLHSRYEPFAAYEKKQPPHPADKTKSVPSSKGSTANEHKLSRPTAGHHENKLERFIHRVGNLLHKNKQ